MKKLVALTLIAALCGICGQAQAAKVWDDMSWWGNTGATPEPHPDSKGRSGYWWWPIEPASNVGDTELWGNRGIVYHSPWERPMEPEPVEPPDVPDVVTRSIPVLNNVLFDFDKSNIRSDAQPIIAEVVTYMNEFPTDTVLIEGHTDAIGTDAYNMALGQRRADSVAAALTAAGIAPSRITDTVSFGESNPVAPNDTRENRQLNRRAVFVVTLGE